MSIPKWAMAWSAPGFRGFADPMNEVYGAVFRSIRVASHICAYADTTIGGHAEGLGRAFGMSWCSVATPVYMATR